MSELSSNDMKKNSDRVSFKDIIFLKYGSSTGSIFVELEYVKHDNTLNFQGVSYSDHDLEKYVEGNPHVLRNIDAKLRNQSQKYNYNLYILK